MSYCDQCRLFSCERVADTRRRVPLWRLPCGVRMVSREGWRAKLLFDKAPLWHLEGSAAPGCSLTNACVGTTRTLPSRRGRALLASGVTVNGAVCERGYPRLSGLSPGSALSPPPLLGSSLVLRAYEGHACSGALGGAGPRELENAGRPTGTKATLAVVKQTQRSRCSQRSCCSVNV